MFTRLSWIHTLILGLTNGTRKAIFKGFVNDVMLVLTNGTCKDSFRMRNGGERFLPQGFQGLLVAEHVLAGLHDQGQPRVDGLVGLLNFLLGAHFAKCDQYLLFPQKARNPASQSLKQVTCSSSSWSHTC